ncbi:MAG TPA: CPBP family intramembrane glutamic endopeptidase [Ktedonobacterales bacterium]|nr:CPBP family intramembrane glutamic endopeptidase [Ktedonobacterales bacterium]
MKQIGDTPAVAQAGATPARPSWGRLIATLALLLAIIGAISYGAFAVAYPFGWLARPETRLATFLIGAIVGELAALGALIGLLRRRGTGLRALGLGKPATWRGLALGLAVAIVYAGLTAALNPTVGPNLLKLTFLKGLAIVAALVAGLVEETIFRGYVMTSLQQMGRGRVAQVLVSGAAFAIAHFYGFVSPTAILTTFGFTFLLGAALAITYLVSRRSLTPVIVSHTLIDIVIEPWLLLGFFTGAA